MRLTLDGISKYSDWEKAGIRLPSYNIQELRCRTLQHPIWVHMGVGNIFRMFIADIADDLISKGELEKGIICVSPYDHEMVDRVYRPHDNLVLSVTFNRDKHLKMKVLGSVAKAVAADFKNQASKKEIESIAGEPELQLISLTITEKGYALYGKNGNYLESVQRDIEEGPESAESAMGIVCAVLYKRFLTCRKPLSLVSMDNCANNGLLLKSSVLTLAQEWVQRGFCSSEFLNYIANESQIAFPCTMIDKITPRPSEDVSKILEELGVEGMERFITAKNTYAAPFVNGESFQYLVVEDSFPNGRPPFEKAGVFMTDRETVHKTERMKVTACLNPLHTALAVYGCLLGYSKISDEMLDEDLVKLIRLIGEKESLPVLEKPDIISPDTFLQDVIASRLPNPMLPDTPQRIACDTSQKVGIRYGETIKSYVKIKGNARSLLGIPLAIAGWCRYLLAVDDEGNSFELSPDPMLETLVADLKEIRVGSAELYRGQLVPILKNEKIFGIDLYQAGIGNLVEQLFLEEIKGKSAVRTTLRKYL